MSRNQIHQNVWCRIKMLLQLIFARQSSQPKIAKFALLRAYEYTQSGINLPLYLPKRINSITQLIFFEICENLKSPGSNYLKNGILNNRTYWELYNQCVPIVKHSYASHFSEVQYKAIHWYAVISGHNNARCLNFNQKVVILSQLALWLLT